MTLSKLKALRKAAFIPGPSFDFDGDGYVGQKEFFIGKLFDKDGDGKLNEEERATAMNALKNVSTFKL